MYEQSTNRLTSFSPSWLIACAVGLVLVGIAYFVVWPLLQSVSFASQIEGGRVLYVQYCAACHGVDLEGQPDWQTRKADGKLPAPPHDETGHTWHHSDDQLFKITKLGVAAIVPNYPSDMIGFGNQMTEEQIRSVIEYIKSTWPQRQREYQEQRNQVQQ